MTVKTKPKIRLKVEGAGAVEADVVRALKLWATLYPEVQLFRYHVGGVPTGKGGKRKHEHKGAADFFLQIFYMGYPILAFFECKGPDGRLSDVQKGFRDQIQTSGGYYFIIQSIQDAEDALETIKQETRRKTPTGFGGYGEQHAPPSRKATPEGGVLGSNKDRLLDAQVRVASKSGEVS